MVFGNSIPAWAKLGVDYQMALGNPTAATTDPSKTNNYLISRSQYAMSYNGLTHQPNWVSWSISTNSLGSAPRTDAWSQETLPTGYYRVGTGTFGTSYGINWDRGHMCPSADRTFTTLDNELTFRMSNIIPQAATNNQGLWADFENYCRDLIVGGTTAARDNEVLIISGPSEFTGNRLSNLMAIPGSVWKIAVVTSNSSSGFTASQRINTNMFNIRVIALLTPNVNTGLGSWQSYITSVEEIEQVTGFNFFTNLDPTVATYLKNVVDTGTGQNKPTVISSFTPVSGLTNTTVTISGYHFGGSPVVQFNGVTANRTVNTNGTVHVITATVPPGAASGPITVTGTGGTDTSANDFTVATGTEPALGLSAEIISSLASIEGSAGTSQSYTVTGSNLTGNITVTAPTNFEVSLNNSSFAGSLTISNSGSVSQIVYVRIKSTAPLGSVSGTVTHGGGGATTQNLSVSGTVSSNQPSLTLSTASLTGFSALQGSASTSKSYTVSGVNLSGTITLTVPSGFEISTNNSTFFTNSVSLTPSGTTLGATMMYVRIHASAAVGTVSGSITHSGGGASSVNLSLSGSVTASGGSANESWFSISGANTKGSPNISQSFGNQTGVWINEFHYDTAGTDTGEFIEVVIAPDVTASLANISVVLVNYNAGVTQDYATHSLDTFQAVPAINGYRVFYKDISGIQNGAPDGLAIVLNGITVQFLSYEGSFSGTAGVTQGLTSVDIGVSENGVPVDSSLQLTGGPIITSTNAVTATNYVSFAYQITTSNNAVSYNASGLPHGLSINTTNGLISGTNQTTPGTYTIGLSAINSAGEGTQNLTLTLLKNAGAPTITSASNATAYLRSAFSFTATANPAATAYSFSGLPAGLTSSGATISGTPTNAGTFNVGITATNSLGSDAQNLTLTVLDPVISLSTNSIAGLSSTVGKEGSVQAYTISGSNLTSNITVTAPNHFRISADGADFTDNPITLTPTDGTLSGKMLFVSLATNAPAGLQAGTVTHSGGGALPQNLAVAGTVIQPVLTLSPTNGLVGFSTRVGVASSSQNYTVSGTDLTGGITVTPPAGFELSTDNATFSESLLLIPSAGTLGSRTVFVRISSATSAGALIGSILHEGGDAVSQSLSVSGDVVQPSISLFANSLAAFSANLGSASDPQTYTVSGEHLTGSITVSAPPGFEVSLDGSSYGPSRTLVPVAGSLSNQTVYARLSSSAPLGPSTGTITHGGGDAAQQGVAVSGNVISTSPVLTLSAVNMSGFSALAGFAGDSQSYTLSGSSLTNNVIVTAPDGFELSLDQIIYAASLTLTPSAGAIHNLPIFVRLESATVAGPVEGAILHTSGGAETVSLPVSGAVTEATPVLTLSTAALTGFSTTAGTFSAIQTYQVSGVYLKGPITVTPSSPFEVSQDGTNFATNLTLVPSGGALSNIAVRVRISSLASTGNLAGTVLHGGGGASNQILSVNGQVSAPAAPPAIISTLSGAVYTNSTFSYTIAVATNTNSTNTTYTYSASNLPIGFSINASTGLISGTSTNVSSTNVIQLFASSTQGIASATYRLRTMTTTEQTNLPLSVVVNKYLNSSVDRIELLVTGDEVNGPPVDLRGMVVKDTSSTMTEDFGGKFVFNDIPFWSRVKAGTLLVLSAGTTTPEDLDPSDFVLWVNLGNSAYITTAAGGFDIGNTEMVMIKTADGGADGVAGGIHALAVGSLGTQYNNFKGKKISNTLQLNNKKGNSNNFTGPVAGVLNSTANLLDFTAASGVGYSTNTNFFGSPNSTGNSNFITALRAKDQDGPVISVAGTNPITIAHSTNVASFVDPGASASDAVNGSRPVTTNNPVNPSIVGTYVVTYSASDASGNVSTATRTVNVIDQTPPMITLMGANPAQVTYGSPFSDPGATATDAVDGNLTSYIQVFRPIQTASVGVGTYSLQYVVTDFSGNASDTLTRTVQVVKATPTITSTPTASAITVGQSLSSSVLSGGSASVSGTFAWSSPSTLPGSTGSYEVRFTPTDSTNYNTVTTMVNVTVNTNPLNGWAVAFGLSGANAEAGADPDGDGWSNAQEYAFGLNPTNRGGSLAGLTQSTNQVKLTFLQKDTGGIIYAVKAATSLTGGFTNSIPPQEASDQNGVPAGYKKYEATLSTTNGRGFLKVEATIPP